MVNNYISIVHVCFLCYLFLFLGVWGVGCWVLGQCVCWECVCCGSVIMPYRSFIALANIIGIRVCFNVRSVIFLLVQFNLLFKTFSHSQRHASAICNSRTMQSKFVYKFMDVRVWRVLEAPLAANILDLL